MDQLYRTAAYLNRRQRQAGMALLRGNALHDAAVAPLESVAQRRGMSNEQQQRVGKKRHGLSKDLTAATVAAPFPQSSSF